MTDLNYTFSGVWYYVYRYCLLLRKFCTMGRYIQGLLMMIALFSLHGQEDYTISYRQTSNSITEVSFHINSWDWDRLTVAGTTFQTLHFSASTTTMQAGWASLPIISASLQLPPDRNVTLQIKHVDYQYDTLSYPLLPSRGILYRNQDPAHFLYAIDTHSLVNAYYPEEMIRMEEPFIVRDVRGTTLRLSPFQYDAVTHVVRIATRVVVELVENAQQPTNPLANENPHPVRDAVQMYRSLFLNYEPSDARAALHAAEVGDLLVITPPHYEAAIAPYVQWKREMGYSVEVAVVQRGAYVAHLIKNRYQANPNLFYVQLVGDWDDLKSDLTPSNAPTDPMIGAVSGSDPFPDLAIGRFSCSSPEELSVQVQKVINYEKNPNSDPQWRETFLGIASLQGGITSGDDSESDQEHIERIYYRRLKPFTYNHFLENFEPNASSSLLIQQINQGASAIAYAGHGTETSITTTAFDNSQVDQLNNGEKLPFIVSVACLNGAFHRHSDCLGEAMLKRENGGAVVALMSSIVQAWAPPQRGQDYFFDILSGGYDYAQHPDDAGITTEEQRTRWGAIVVNSFNLMLAESNEYADRETVQTWTTLGDVSLQLRTQQPRPLQISHSQLTAGEPFIATIRCEYEPLANAWVSLSQEGKCYSALTDENGAVTIPHGFLSGDVLLVVTAFNTNTIYHNIKCTPYAEPFPVVTSYKPERVASGETGQITLTIKNMGTVSLPENMIVNLSCSDPHISWQSIARASCSSLMPNQEVTLASPLYQFTVAPHLPTGYTFDVVVEMLSRDARFETTLTLMVLGDDCQTPVDFYATEIPNGTLLTWDSPSSLKMITLFDDGESHEPFAVNSSGALGWRYIDGDAMNTGIYSTFSFPNVRSPMAYIMMNTELTTPAGVLAAHSGQQFWASPYSVTHSWSSTYANDDWLVSPPLRFREPFTLSFYARSFSSYPTQERFYVEYATRGCQSGDFYRLHPTPEIAPNEWTLYTYTIPAEAMYVAIHCVSNYQYLFGVDDISISGYAIEGYTYDVYRDGELIASDLIQGFFVDTEQLDGEHCYTITAHCPQHYSALPTEPQCVQNAPSVVQEFESTSITIFPNPASHHLTVAGKKMKSIEIYNAVGQCVAQESPQGESVNISLSALTSGVYYVRVYTDQPTPFVQKIVVQKY